MITLPVTIFILLYFTKCGMCLDCSTASYICAQNSDRSCEDCVQSHPCCSWCLDYNFTEKRCNTKEKLIQLRCQTGSIYSGGNSNINDKEIKNASFKDPDETKNQPAVQIRPQELNVQLRLKEPLSFQLQYKAAVDYPLDLYYLTDLTYTMKEDVQTMINLGSAMTEFLKNLTKTYKIGFGYFMDKVVMPYSFNNKELLENPCKRNGFTCEKGYDFIHALNFTQTVSEFTQKLKSSKITANLDNLEGAGDAIMQILLCKDYMQWRTYSRKLIVVATAGFFHFSGDGVLAGIVKRNTEYCLIGNDGSYTGALEYDFPSLEEIYRKLLQYKVNILFAAKENLYSYYNELQQTIPSVTYIGKLDERSKNIFSLIEKSYMEVVSSVRFQANAPDGVRVTFKSTCNKPGLRKETNSCNNIKIGEVYTFDVTLELEKLPTKLSETIIIEEMNLAENVKINVEYVGIHCDCGKQVVNTSCNGHGQFQCGKCNCDEGWTGDNCQLECRRNPCRFVNETYTSSTCFSHGECDTSTCTCICDYNYMGTYCEYNQCKRNRLSRVICSNRGTCVKGTCICFENYGGDDCSCYKGNDTCIVPGQVNVCNGVGTCECGKCVCPKEYAGERCEYCPSCAKICQSYDNCVISIAQNKSTHACSSNETKYIVEEVNKIEAKCLTRYYNDRRIACEIEYSYFVVGDNIELKYLKPYCSSPVNASTPAITAFVIVILAGLIALIVWKCIVRNKDKKAYQTFCEEVTKSNFSKEENPIYRSPVRKYFNPLNQNSEVFESDMKID